MARLDIQLTANNEVRNNLIQGIRLLKQARALLEPARDNILQLVETTDYKAVSTYLVALDGGTAPTGDTAHDTFGTTIYNLVNGAVADLHDGDVASLIDRVFE